jgi:3-(3-hydroxy-phenyl)propionate hydroxylase
MVGCDGARSTVRRLVGATMHDLEFEEAWLVLDLVLDDGTAPPTDVALQVCDPARPHTLVPMPAPRCRLEFMLLPGEDPANFYTETVVRELLTPWIDPDHARIERSAVYAFHGQTARLSIPTRPNESLMCAASSSWRSVSVG